MVQMLQESTNSSNSLTINKQSQTPQSLTHQLGRRRGGRAKEWKEMAVGRDFGVNRIITFGM
jgi:hypothetical protein